MGQAVHGTSALPLDVKRVAAADRLLGRLTGREARQAVELGPAQGAVGKGG